MGDRRKYEEREAFLKRDRERKRKERAEKRTPLKIPREIAEVQGVAPIKLLYALIGRRIKHPEETTSKELLELSNAFRALANGLRCLQMLATSDELKQIVQIAHPHLPPAQREQVEAVLHSIDRRSGVVPRSHVSPPEATELDS